MFARATRAARLAISIEARILQDPRTWALRARAAAQAKAQAAAQAGAQAEDQAGAEAAEAAETSHEAPSLSSALRGGKIVPDPISKKRFTIWRALEMIVEYDGDREDFRNGHTLRAMFDRLDNDPAYENYADVDMSETLARLCQDLGLVARWTDWHLRGWTISLDEARARGSPYVLPGVEYDEIARSTRRGPAYPEASQGSPMTDARSP